LVVNSNTTIDTTHTMVLTVVFELTTNNDNDQQHDDDLLRNFDTFDTRSILYSPLWYRKVPPY
jgi:hypothetical protein